MLFTLRSHAQVAAAASFHGIGERMTYAFQGTASGTFQPDSGAATTFTNESFTITAIAEAGAVVTSTQRCAVSSGVCKLFSVPVASANISVAGLTATITSPMAIFDNQTFPALGLQRQTGADLLDLQGNNAFAIYDLNGNLALQDPFFRKPTAVAQFDCAHGCVMTTLGSLTVASVQNVRFTATQTEPGQ
jgi:hypothetical protein